LVVLITEGILALGGRGLLRASGLVLLITSERVSPRTSEVGEAGNIPGRILFGLVFLALGGRDLAFDGEGYTVGAGDTEAGGVAADLSKVRWIIGQGRAALTFLA
jgi:hypothetical protein